MINLFKKNLNNEIYSPVVCKNNEIIAPVNAVQIALEEVNDQVFSEKIMGDGVAFKLQGEEITVCAPANGTLSVMFKTGHAFGVTTVDGIEILIHIGIDTVELNGDGYKVLDKKTGDILRAGEPVVRVNLKKVREKYDTTTMLIITNDNGHKIIFSNPGEVTRGQVIAIISNMM